MMNKQIRTRRKLAILLALIILAVVAFVLYYMVIQANMEQAVRYPLGSSYQETGSYEIDPQTILASLERGETDVFKPISATPEANNAPYTPSPVGVISWNQSDYLKVASALHQFVWKENLKGWHIYSLYFFRGCQDNPTGFESGEITYFKAIYGPLSYTTRAINIYPIGSGVSWGGKANFPRPLLGWKEIDLQRLKVAADDALKIAEENGGRDARLNFKNDCTIDVFLNPNPDRDDDWHIVYSNNRLPTGSSSIFEMNINPYTGEHKIVVVSQ